VRRVVSRVGFRVVGAMAGLSLLGACGIPTDAAPRPLEVPPLEESPGAVPGEGRLRVYMFDDQDLLRTRQRAGAADLTLAITELLKGTTVADRAQGISTSIPPGITLIGAAVDETGVATIDLSLNLLEQVVGESQIRAAAQIVETAMQADRRVQTVQVTFLQQPVRLQVVGGQVPDRPLRRDDFLPFLPSGGASPSTAVSTTTSSTRPTTTTRATTIATTPTTSTLDPASTTLDPASTTLGGAEATSTSASAVVTDQTPPASPGP
jgi:hypothetical protein